MKIDRTIIQKLKSSRSLSSVLQSSAGTMFIYMLRLFVLNIVTNLLIVVLTLFILKIPLDDITQNFENNEIYHRLTLYWNIYLFYALFIVIF